MRLISGRDSNGDPAFLTLEAQSHLRDSRALRLYRPDGKGSLSGDLLGEIELEPDDERELKADLTG